MEKSHFSRSGQVTNVILRIVKLHINLRLFVKSRRGSLNEIENSWRKKTNFYKLSLIQCDKSLFSFFFVQVKRPKLEVNETIDKSINGNTTTPKPTRWVSWFFFHSINRTDTFPDFIPKLPTHTHTKNGWPLISWYSLDQWVLRWQNHWIVNFQVARNFLRTQRILFLSSTTSRAFHEYRKEEIKRKAQACKCIFCRFSFSGI